MKHIVLLTAVLLADSSLAGEGTDKPKVGVLDFSEVNVTPEFSASVAAEVANELDRTGAFRLTTSEAIKELLALERQRQLLGCGADDSCMIEIVDALGLDYLVSGKVLKTSTGAGQQWAVTLTLLDVRNSRREGSDSRTAPSESQLLAEARGAARKVVAGLLRARSGTLALTVSEPGATVKLDDIAVGSSPLSAPISVPAGVHRISVEKKGFLSSEIELRIAAGAEVKQEVKLLPSEDYAREHAQHHGRMRLGAWIATGVAGAGLLVGGLGQLRAQTLYGDGQTPATFLYHRAQLAEGVESSDGVNHRQEAQRLGAEIDSSELLSQVALVAAGVAGAGAAYFWIAGEDPDRYRQPGAITLTMGAAPGAFVTGLQIVLP